MNPLSLSETLDGIIVEVLDSGHDHAIARVEVPLVDSQRRYIEEQADLGQVIASIKSTKARIGIDQEAKETNGVTFKFKGRVVEYTAELTPSTREYLRDTPFSSIFLPGTLVGRLQAQNPKRQLDAEKADYVLRRNFRFPNVNGTQPLVQRDGTILLPMWQVSIQAPQPSGILSYLSSIMQNPHMSREGLDGLMQYRVAEKPQLDPHSLVIFSVPLGTAGYEMVITDPRHGNSRAASRNTNWERFHFEMKGGSAPQTIDHISVKLYKPLLIP